MSDDKILAKFSEQFERHCEFDRTMKMKYQINAPGDITYFITAEKEHESSPKTMHGGAISAIMDATLGLAALSLSMTEKMLVATVEFKLNFIRPVVTGQKLEAHGKVEHSGKSLIISEAKIIEVESGELVAKALGTFNKYPLSKKGWGHIYE